MKKQLIKVGLYVVLLFVLLAGILYAATPDIEYITPTNGYTAIPDQESSERLFEISTKNWEFYPGKFYYPQDLTESIIDQAEYSGYARTSDYGTYRLCLELTPGKNYKMTGHSFNFSQRMYINGSLAGETGTPGTTRGETVPDSRTYEYHFTADDDGITEIIVHASSFYHREGAGNASFRLGSDEAVDRWRAQESIRTGIISGSLLTVFLYYLGMFIFFRRQPHFLYIALAALMTVMRLSLTGEKYIMELFPHLDWSVAIRLEYLFNSLFVVFLLMYFVSLYPGMINKWIVRLTIGFLSLYFIIVIFCDTLAFTRLLPLYTVLWAVASLITLWGMTLRLRKGDIHTALIYIGLVIFAATAAFDEIMFFISQTRTYHTIVIGTMVCILMNMIALTFNLSKVEEELDEAKRQHRQLDDTNRLLDKMNKTKANMMSNISHEMKTPLTVMSSNAQLSKTLIRSEGDVEEIVQYLDTITNEAERMSRMMSGVLDLGKTQETQNEMMVFDIKQLIEKSAGVFRPMIQKRGIRLVLDIPDDLPEIYGNPDMVTQVILNLLSNSNRHTKHGVISITAALKNNYIETIVKDTGKGIDADKLPHVFERYIHTEGGLGLGLPICMDIIKNHNGDIQIKSTKGLGTEVSFIIPVYIKDESNE